MKKKIFTVGCLLICLLLVACSKDQKSNQQPDLKQNQLAQSINISSPTPLLTLDTTQTTDKNTFTFVQHLFEGLFRFDDDSTPIPGLAKDVTISEDGLIYKFTLRDDIRWSDGQPITAHDFLFAWKRLVNPETLGPNAYLLDNVVNSRAIRMGEKSIDEIGLQANGDSEFEVTLIQPQASFLTVVSIGWLAPQNQTFVHKLGKEYALDSEKLLYSGPFILTNWDVTMDSWVLKPNPEYYDAEKVKLKEVNVSVLKEENTGISLYQSDQLDLTKISGQYVQQHQLDPGYVTHMDVANYFIDFNKKSGTPGSNVHFRKAVAQAVDKTALAKNVLNDGSQPLDGLIPRELIKNPETSEDFRKYSGAYLVYDVKAAQAEWRKAQVDLGDKIKVSLLVTDDEQGKKIAEYVQSQLLQHLPGIEVTIASQPKNNLLQSRRDRDFELSISGWIAASSDLDSYFNLYETQGVYNYGAYSNTNFDQLVNTAKTTNANQPSKQFADYKRAEYILLNEDAALVPLYQSASNYLINPRIKQISYHLYGDYFNLRDAYLN